MFLGAPRAAVPYPREYVARQREREERDGGGGGPQGGDNRGRETDNGPDNCLG